jgi:hypothetical protein
MSTYLLNVSFILLPTKNIARGCRCGGSARCVRLFVFVRKTKILDLARIFNKPVFSDISFVFPDGREIYGHRFILAYVTVDKERW